MDLNQKEVKTFLRESSSYRVVLDRLDVDKIGRKRPMPLLQVNEVAQQSSQTNSTSSINLIYKNHMKKAIKSLTATMQTTFEERLTDFIAGNEENFNRQLNDDKITKLTKKHADELNQLRYYYETKLANLQIERDRAVADAMKKQWCTGCGKGTENRMMMFCNNFCQNKHV